MLNKTMLNKCVLCPRQCGVNRNNGEKGFCKMDNKIYVASVCAHKGEEPVISGKNGICNVFFAHCNMQCVFCQNCQISNNEIDISQYEISLEDLTDKIINILNQNINILGFVSATHCVVQMIEIITALADKGYHPVIVYNTNAYDNVTTLRMLENIVNIYLPDFKYIDSNLAAEYSEAPNYPEVCKQAIKEMYRQKGSSLITDEQEMAESGLIIRHLILPNHLDNSREILRYISEEISLRVHISLMAQYYPTHRAAKLINRKITRQEYQDIIEYMEKIGLYNGYFQEMESADNYLPDFEKEKTFAE